MSQHAFNSSFLLHTSGLLGLDARDHADLEILED
jgi:hypothetical protein